MWLFMDNFVFIFTVTYFIFILLLQLYKLIDFIQSLLLYNIIHTMILLAIILHTQLQRKQYRHHHAQTQQHKKQYPIRMMTLLDLSLSKPLALHFVLLIQSKPHKQLNQPHKTWS